MGPLLVPAASKDIVAGITGRPHACCGLTQNPVILALCCSPQSTCWLQSRGRRPLQKGPRACLLARKSIAGGRASRMTQATKPASSWSMSWLLETAVDVKSDPGLLTNVRIRVFQMIKVACRRPARKYSADTSSTSPQLCASTASRQAALSSRAWAGHCPGQQYAFTMLLPFSHLPGRTAHNGLARQP